MLQKILELNSSVLRAFKNSGLDYQIANTDASFGTVSQFQTKETNASVVT